ncbi:MAG: hypothetical protein WC466_07945, partial [Candidatus Izemoplasmatales bacterium]
LRKIIRENIDSVFFEAKDFFMDEMAYPESFDFEKFKSINSYSGRLNYAKQHLLGKVGAGSSRVVFKIDSEKVLKVALNSKGLAQNSAESEGYKQNYDVLARVFDVDYNDTWIEMELAKKVTESRFKQLTKTTPNEVVGWLMEQRGEKTYWLPNVDLKENEFAQEMQDFVFDYDYPLPGDFTRTSSYGEVLRDGIHRIVVVDFGYDQGTKDIYRSKKKKVGYY